MIQDAKFTGVIQLLFSSFRRVSGDEVKAISKGKESSDHCFKIITPTRTFYLQAESDEAAENWIEHLNQICLKLWDEENMAVSPSMQYFPS
jgi:hypothetical protein